MNCACCLRRFALIVVLSVLFFSAANAGDFASGTYLGSGVSRGIYTEDVSRDMKWRSCYSAGLWAKKSIITENFLIQTDFRFNRDVSVDKQNH